MPSLSISIHFRTETDAWEGYNVIPFIIEDSKKNFYYRGLKEWRNEKGWLTDTCLDGQDTFVRLLDMLEITL